MPKNIAFYCILIEDLATYMIHKVLKKFRSVFPEMGYFIVMLRYKFHREFYEIVPSGKNRYKLSTRGGVGEVRLSIPHNMALIDMWPSSSK